MDAETAGFKVAVEGTTATVVLKEPYETARSGSAPYQENDDGKTVTLNVKVVPGLYYAVDSAGKMSVAERRTPYEAPRRRFPQSALALQSHDQRRSVVHG